MARVLITGGTGLLGRWVLRHWPTDVENMVVSHSRADLTDPAQFRSAIRAAQPDALLHLAWSASGTPNYRDARDNALWVSASMAAAEHCMEQGIRFIGTGTAIDDEGGLDSYARSKYELRARLGNEIENERVTWLRPFHVFDPVAARPKLMADAFRAIKDGKAVHLESPRARHDFVHGSDVGRAIVLIVLRDLRGVIDIGSGRLRSVADVVEACGASWECDAAACRSEHDGPTARQAPLRTYGWQPTATDWFFTDSA